MCYDGRTDIAQVFITYGADVDLVNEVSKVELTLLRRCLHLV